MAATGIGLLLEEHRGEIVSAWRQAVERETGTTEPALAFAVAPLVREMALALGGRADSQRSYQARMRCAVLVRSSAAPAQLAREVKILHRCIWAVLRAHGTAVTQTERLEVDEWLDETLAEALERSERVRLRMSALERAPVVVPPLRARAVPPPLPPRARFAAPLAQPARAQPARAQPVRGQPTSGAQPVRGQPSSTRPGGGLPVGGLPSGGQPSGGQPSGGQPSGGRQAAEPEPLHTRR